MKQAKTLTEQREASYRLSKLRKATGRPYKRVEGCTRQITHELLRAGLRRDTTCA